MRKTCVLFKLQEPLDAAKAMFCFVLFCFYEADPADKGVHSGNRS